MFIAAIRFKAPIVGAKKTRYWSDGAEHENAKNPSAGGSYAEFDDPLYDEIVCPGFKPSGLLEASRRLLLSLGANLSSLNESK